MSCYTYFIVQIKTFNLRDSIALKLKYIHNMVLFSRKYNTDTNIIRLNLKMSTFYLKHFYYSYFLSY